MLDGMSGTQLDDTARHFWSHRPRRVRHGRKVAGVAAGIGARYEIDPIVVRVALAVTTVFGGAGVLLYLLGWLLFPEDGDEASALESLFGKGHSSTSKVFTIILCFALVPASSWFFGGTWFFGGHFSGFLALALLLAALYALHKHRGGNVAEQPRQQAPAAHAAATAVDGGSGYTAETHTTEPYERTTPPAWDPLGAAPFAWDLPEPSPAPEPPEPRKPRSRVGLVTLGAALVAVGVCVGLAPLTGGWMTPAHAIGIVLGVLGVGLVAGSFREGGRKLIGLAIPLGIIGVLLTNANVGSPPLSGGLGDRNYAPTTVEQVRPSYELTAGNLTLDLTKLPDHGVVTTNVHDMFGDVTVLLPPDADVNIDCQSTAGQVNCLGRSAQGISPEMVRKDDGEDGPGGVVINMDVATTAGNVEVSRG